MDEVDINARDQGYKIEMRLLAILAHLHHVELPISPSYSNLADFSDVMGERARTRHRVICLAAIAAKAVANAK